MLHCQKLTRNLPQRPPNKPLRELLKLTIVGIIVVWKPHKPRPKTLPSVLGLRHRPVPSDPYHQVHHILLSSEYRFATATQAYKIGSRA